MVAAKGLGLSLLELGQTAEAIAPLEDAVRLRAAEEPADRAELGQSRFGLARALWATGGDHARARALAVAARADLATVGPRAAADLASVDAWLAARPR
jgi:hypothetical protein